MYHALTHDENLFPGSQKKILLEDPSFFRMQNFIA